MIRARLTGISFATLILLVPQFAQAQTHDTADVLQPFIDSRTVAGAVTLVANRQGIVDIDAIGWADIDDQRPMQPDALFWIASMSKPIAGTALMMLVEEGKISLDDPVEKYLPEYKGEWLAVERDQTHQLLKHPSRPITIRDTLSHVSGLPHRSPVEVPTLDALPLRTVVRSFAVMPLEFEPGTSYLYSNGGINTAGRILEVVTGKSYEQFLQERLFDPLGMTDTTFWPSQPQLTRLASSYKAGPEKKGLVETTIPQLTYPLDDREHRYPIPGGGLFSTAADMATFARMILNEGELNGVRYLSPASVAEMTKRQTAESLPKSYGLGWNIAGKNCSHGGAFSTNMELDRDRDLVLIYMVQHADYPGNGKDANGVFRKGAVEKFSKPNAK
ncbi:serine hydrolase domain-containing protein [Planctomicrobium piriforme]|uniref:CubicO group peptidase, beta-lactamase class C family n=1 Tax=Planctomicrobium piriforme TaxID=1576369 RepID=A0A1I3PEP8_9PLAN|nr:serine hydrolase domain-containing protein [Planctomicrobium piriforme]SFJ19962.1 CubicO group peptidase, beta-lactamase class C family [Planctomicrobium piriforme]